MCLLVLTDTPVRRRIKNYRTELLNKQIQILISGLNWFNFLFIKILAIVAAPTNFDEEPIPNFHLFSLKFKRTIFQLHLCYSEDLSRGL